MRNNAQHGAKLDYADLFEQQSRVEQIRRFFVAKRQKIFKHFTLQDYQTNFRKVDIAPYIVSLDLLLLMDLSYEEFAQIDFDRTEKLNEFKRKADTMV